MSEALAALLDPENAPARHGEWHPAHRPVAFGAVILTDDDGCDLSVEPWEVAVMVNMAVDALAASERPPVDPLRDLICQLCGERVADCSRPVVDLEEARAALASPAVPRPEGLAPDAARLLAYLWTATGTDGETQPNYLFSEDDPLVADVRAVLARLSDTGDTPSVVTVNDDGTADVAEAS